MPPKENDIPKPIMGFIEAVCSAFEVEELMGEISYSYRRPRSEDDEWIIEVYTIPMEILRGKDDGAEVTPNFTVDLEKVRRLFDTGKKKKKGWKLSVHFENHGGHVPQVSFCGEVGGKTIMLDVLSCPPEGVKPGFTVDSVTGGIREKDKDVET
jgi:hypothetical protein